MRVALFLALILPLAAVPCVDYKDARYKDMDQRTVRESDSAKMAVHLNQLRRCETTGPANICRFEANDFAVMVSTVPSDAGKISNGSLIVNRIGPNSPFVVAADSGSRCATVFPGKGSDLICIAWVYVGLLDGRVYGDGSACERAQESLTKASRESR
jgi:hypothetical protein